MEPKIALSDEELAVIHLKVYWKYGYLTLQDGLRAFKRIRRFVDNKNNMEKAPPSHLKEKIAIWAKINKEIQLALHNHKEALKHGTKEDNIEQSDERTKAGKVTSVFIGTEGKTFLHL